MMVANRETQTISFPSSAPSQAHRETAKARAAYHEYEAMGTERSLAKVAAKLGKPAGYTRQLETWSSQFHWQDRVKKYEDRLGEEKRKKRQAELEKMDEEHSLIGRTQLLRSVRLIEQLLDAPGTTLSSAVSLMKAGYELERLARGAATNRIEGDISVVVQPKEYINIDPDECGSEP
jgi:hypothetical protein